MPPIEGSHSLGVWMTVIAKSSVLAVTNYLIWTRLTCITDYVREENTISTVLQTRRVWFDLRNGQEIGWSVVDSQHFRRRVSENVWFTSVVLENYVRERTKTVKISLGIRKNLFGIHCSAVTCSTDGRYWGTSRTLHNISWWAVRLI